MKEHHVLIYFEQTPDSHDSYADYGIRVGKIEEYLKANGKNGLDDLISCIDNVKRSILEDYWPRVRKEV